MSRRSSRRSFLKYTAATGALLATQSHGASAETDPWARVPVVHPPRFPHRHFPVTRFGAVGDGVTDCTAAFADAVARLRACRRRARASCRPAAS